MNQATGQLCDVLSAIVLVAIVTELVNSPLSGFQLHLAELYRDDDADELAARYGPPLRAPRHARARPNPRRRPSGKIGHTTLDWLELAP